MTSRRHSPPLLVLLGSLVLAVAAAIVPAAPANAVPLRPTGPLSPDAGALLGLYSKPPNGDYTIEGLDARLNHLENKAGRDVDIVSTYYSFTENFPGAREDWLLSEGKIPLISWDGTTSTEISAGQHDALIRDRADGVAALGSDVFLRFFWEMDGGKKRDIVVSPADFIAAWRRVVNTFRNRGATNAVFVWCPNSISFTQGTAEQYYPGDEYVDWICAHGYNWAPAKPNSNYRSLTEIFGSFHAWGMAHGTKPMMIGETGVQENNQGDKPAWLRSVPDELLHNMPGVSAFVYFDSDTIYPWWLDSSWGSFNAWRDLAQHPHFNGVDLPSDYIPPPETTSETISFTGSGSPSNQSWQPFEFDITVPGTIDITLGWARGDANLNLYLRDPSGSPAAASVTNSRPETTSFRATEIGTYVASVQFTSGPQTDFTLDVTRPIPLEGGGSSDDGAGSGGGGGYAATETLVFNGSGSPTSNSWQPREIQVAVAGPLDVTLEWPEADADLNVFLRAPDGSPVAASNGSQRPEAFSYHVDSPGTYTVSVQFKSGPESTYDLTVVRPVEDDGIPVLSDTLAIEGSGSASGDSWQGLVFRVVDPGRVTLTLSWTDGTADLNMFLRDQANTPIGMAKTGEQPEVLVRDLAEPGVYTVYVQFRSGAADFTLNASIE